MAPRGEYDKGDNLRRDKKSSKFNMARERKTAREQLVRENLALYGMNNPDEIHGGGYRNKHTGEEGLDLSDNADPGYNSPLLSSMDDLSESGSWNRTNSDDAQDGVNK